MIFPLAGNEKLRDTLTSAIETDRLPHAILLEGDAGLGRHTLARFIAKAALCGENKKPCDACNSCHLFDAGTHPDYVLVTAEAGKKSLSVDRVREVRSQAFIKPHISAKRVFVFDRCDGMNEQSQNALLKVLEEPPGGVVFILIAESRMALLDTIVSRCVTLTLSPPSRAQALEVLKGRLQEDTAVLSDALDETGNNIGAALLCFSEKSCDEAAYSAKEFLRLLFEGNELEQMKLLCKFEKDRVAADGFFSSLKKQTAKLLRENRTNTAKARILNRLYGQLCEYEGLLKTNINLPLLFSALVCKSAADKRG